MRVLRERMTELNLVNTRQTRRGREVLDARRRQATAEVMGVPRCPHCGGELVARMGRGQPGFWCRCPVRRVLAQGA